MAKLVFPIVDVPDASEIKKGFYDKGGNLLHMGLIPEKQEELKKLLDFDKLVKPKTKKILFVIVRDIIQTLNESGTNRWMPDILKTIFTPMIVMRLLNNKLLIELLEDK